MRISRQILGVVWALLCTASLSAAAAGGVIAGVVRSEADNSPVGRARVAATPVSGGAPRVTIAGADGRFEFPSVPAGDYTVTASRTGFVAPDAGRRGAAPTRVSVSDGQRAESIALLLTPAGVIAGRISDEDGAPFGGAIVEALASRFESGQHLLVSVASVQTDDRGDFRIHGLAPGQYYVSAMDPAFTNVAGDKGAVRYAATYFPGVSFVDQARAIAVTGAGEAPRAEFKLRIVPPATVAGRLAAYNRRQLLSGAVVMTTESADGVPMVPPGTITILPDGQFTFRQVLPGRCAIRARGQVEPNGLAFFAEYRLTVNGDNISNLELLLRPGAIVDGRVDFERAHGSAPPPPASLHVRAPFTDGNAFGDALTGVVQQTGAFAIRGVMPGSHQLVVEGLQPPWTVKDITQRGKDVTDVVLELREGDAMQGLRVVVTDASSLLSGTVRTPRGTPAVEASVLVFPVAAQLWVPTNRRMRATRTDATGRYSVAGLPPGNYLAVASFSLDEGDLARRHQIEALQSVATPVSIDAPEARVVVDLRALASAPPASAAR